MQTNNTTNLCLPQEANKPIVNHILLSIFTLGIYPLIWIYKTTDYLNCIPNKQKQNKTTQLLLCMFIPFYQIYWLYTHGQKIDELTKLRGENEAEISTMCLIFGIFCPIVAYFFIQDKINKYTLLPANVPSDSNTFTAISNNASPNQNVIPAQSAAEELKKYKELFDMGVLTEEEFQAKREELIKYIL